MTPKGGCNTSFKKSTLEAQMSLRRISFIKSTLNAMMVLGEIISFDKYTFVVMIVLEKYSLKGVNSLQKYPKIGIGRLFN